MITHDYIIVDFIESSASVTLSGNSSVGAFGQIESNATVLPKVKIGRNEIVGEGTVVTNDIPDNWFVIGVLAKVIKELPLIEF